MNKSALSAAILIAIGLIIYGLSTRYTISSIGDGRVVRLDHWTGEILLCGHWPNNSFSCSNPASQGVVYLDADDEGWKTLTPEEIAEILKADDAAGRAREDAISAAREAQRAASEAANDAAKAALEAANSPKPQ
jgi:hypothetical protein